MCESLDENLNKFPGLLLFVLKCHFILFFFASDAAQADGTNKKKTRVGQILILVNGKCKRISCSLEF